MHLSVLKPTQACIGVVLNPTQTCIAYAFFLVQKLSVHAQNVLSWHHTSNARTGNPGKVIVVLVAARHKQNERV